MNATLRQLIAALKPPSDGCGSTLAAEMFTQPPAEREVTLETLKAAKH